MKWLGLWCLLLVVPACSDGGGSGGPVSGSGGGGATAGKGTGGSPSAGGGTGGGKSTGGSGPTGGSAGKARGAISLHITQTAGCSLMDQWQDFPIIPGGHAVTAAGATRLLEDGGSEGGQQVSVSCSILRAAPPYAFMGKIRIGQIDPVRFIQVSSDVSLMTSAAATMAIGVPDLPEQYGAGLPDLCTLSASEIDLPNGKVKGTLTCGTLEGNTSKEKCKAAESLFVFENCAR